MCAPKAVIHHLRLRVISVVMGVCPDSTRTNWPSSLAAGVPGFAVASNSLAQVMRNTQILIGYSICGHTMSTQSQVALIGNALSGIL